jgi:HEPN domain-containing protein
LARNKKENMDKELIENIEKHINKPFRYYSSARILFISGAYEIAAINFGYAFELMLKWSLQVSDVKFNHRKHNLNELYKLCVDKKVLTLKMSEDFLDFADSLFNSRYPAQIDAIIEREVEKESKFWGISSNFIHYYDDIIVQLDNELERLCASEKCSIFNYACKDFGGVVAQAFWHCNYPAFSKFKNIRPNEFIDFGNEHWHCKAIPFCVPYNENKLDLNFASNYKFQKLNIGNDMKPPQHQVWNANIDHGCLFTSMHMVMSKGEYKFSQTTYSKKIE